MEHIKAYTQRWESRIAAAQMKTANNAMIKKIVGGLEGMAKYSDLVDDAAKKFVAECAGEVWEFLEDGRNIQEDGEVVGETSPSDPQNVEDVKIDYSVTSVEWVEYKAELDFNFKKMAVKTFGKDIATTLMKNSGARSYMLAALVDAIEDEVDRKFKTFKFSKSVMEGFVEELTEEAEVEMDTEFFHGEEGDLFEITLKNQSVNPSVKPKFDSNGTLHHGLVCRFDVNLNITG